MRILTVPTLCFLAVTAQAADRPIAPGKTVYIDKMPEDLDSYIKAEFIKQKVRLVVAATPEQADYILKGTAEGDFKRDWHEGFITAPRDHMSGAIELTDKQTQALVWAAEAGDRSVWFPYLKRGGQRKVASRLVENLRKYIAKK